MPEGSELLLRRSNLPAPYHLLKSLLESRCVTALEKVGLAGALVRMREQVPDEKTSAFDYLMQIKCPRKIVETLIDPILISALNEKSSEASARSARMVVLKALIESKHGYTLGIPKESLSKTILQPAERYLLSRSAAIRLGAKVASVRISERRMDWLALEDGAQVNCDAFVFAISPDALNDIGLDLLTPEKMDWRAIVSAHLFIECIGDNHQHTCVINEPFGWIFNKTADFGLDFGYVQAVASAADFMVNLPKDEIVSLAMRAVKKAWPDVKDSSLKRAMIYRAPQATFATMCSTRPYSTTPYENIFLAGDWTDTGWPATMESAVRSGHAAANAIIDWQSGCLRSNQELTAWNEG